MRWKLTMGITLLLAYAAGASTIHVPGNYPGIQMAIDVAQNGDVILVDPGTYVENLDFLGKEIEVSSTGGSYCTELDGSDTGSVVSFKQGETKKTVLSGFSITNGSGTLYMGSHYGGAGIYIDGASPKIVACRIFGNTFKSAGGSGAGICCLNGSSPLIINCLIYGNWISSTYNTGGGGGIYCGYDSSPFIINCTICNNSAYCGGGLNTYHGSHPTVVNSILWGNESPNGSQIALTSKSHQSYLTISYSDVEFGKTDLHEETNCRVYWELGMIETDPLFADETCNDFHLTYPSPCRDTGDNVYSTETTDFEGDPRMVNGTIDMGADEFFRHLYVTGNKTPGGSIVGKLVGPPGTTPVGLFLGSGILPTPIPTMWGEFWLQAPWFPFLLDPIPSNGILELPTTLPGSISAPYDVPMQALIGLDDDSLTNLYVLEVR